MSGIDGNTTVSLALLVSIISVVGSFISIWRNKKKDDEATTARKEKALEERVKMNVKLDSLCNTTNQILVENKQYLNEISDLKRRVSILEKTCVVYKQYMNKEEEK